MRYLSERYLKEDLVLDYDEWEENIKDDAEISRLGDWVKSEAINCDWECSEVELVGVGVWCGS